jgi:hypothetical protein
MAERLQACCRRIPPLQIEGSAIGAKEEAQHVMGSLLRFLHVEYDLANKVL